MRLRWECECSYRVIAQSIGVSDSSVSDCMQRIKLAGLSWPLPDDITDDQLETKLYPPNTKIDIAKKGELDWSSIHKELKRKNVTFAPSQGSCNEYS